MFSIIFFLFVIQLKPEINSTLLCGCWCGCEYGRDQHPPSGFLLYQRENYPKAKQYFRTVLNVSYLKESEKGHCYRGLGAVATEEKNYAEGYKNFEKYP